MSCSKHAVSRCCWSIRGRRGPTEVGRPKTDRHDCQWIRRLHTYGLLTGAFRPDDAICELRGYLRRHLRFEAQPMLAQIAGVDLTAIEGIDERTTLLILSEIGTDVSAWATEKHFASWLGVAPNPKKSGKYLQKSRTKPSSNRVATALRVAASSLHKSNSVLGAFLRRIKARLGAPKAITATAHKLARLVYRMLKHGTEYVAQGMADYEAKFRARTLRSLERKAAEFCLRLVAAT